MGTTTTTAGGYGGGGRLGGVVRLVENRVRRRAVNIAVHRIPDIVNVHFDAGGMPEAVWWCIVVAVGRRRCCCCGLAAVRWVVVVVVHIVIAVGTGGAGAGRPKTIGRACAVPYPQSGYPRRQLGLSTRKLSSNERTNAFRSPRIERMASIEHGNEMHKLTWQMG